MIRGVGRICGVLILVSWGFLFVFCFFFWVIVWGWEWVEGGRSVRECGGGREIVVSISLLAPGSSPAHCELARGITIPMPMLMLVISLYTRMGICGMRYARLGLDWAEA